MLITLIRCVAALLLFSLILGSGQSAETALQTVPQPPKFEPGKNLDAELPKENPLEALNRIGGLGSLGGNFGLPFLNALANQGEKDHVILTGIVPIATRHYLAEKMPEAFEDRSLKGTDYLKHLERVYTKKPVQRSRVTIVTNFPQDTVGLISDRVGVLSYAQIANNKFDPKRTVVQPVQLLADCEGAFSEVPLAALRLYLTTLTDTGIIYLASEQLDKVEVVAGGARIKIGAWLARNPALKVTRDAKPGVMSIEIAKDHRNPAGRAKLLTSLAEVTLPRE